nr:protocadherin alpha-4-like [Paramormyrops kingsleyae]
MRIQHWRKRRQCLHFVIFILLCQRTFQIRYAIQEELSLGAVVGNVAKDLGLDTRGPEERNLRIVTGTKQDLFQVNQRDGAVFVNQRIDREDLCGKTDPCYINLKAVIENPLEIHHITVQILDVNDHSPSFTDREYRLEIPESTVTGARFQLEEAQDTDIGLNALRSYKLSQNDYFVLETRDLRKDSKIPFLILQKSLDRENIARFNVTLTAVDGGIPPKIGSLNINITVLDANDNAPVCDEQQYTVVVKENIPVGTFLIKINTTDLDEGGNGEVEYSFRNAFRNKVGDLLELNSKTGELTVKGLIDFEESKNYEINIEVSDKGALPLKTQCNVFVKVEDENDNRPEIDITSLSSHVPENAPVGTVVALIAVTDLDSGVNGQVVCTLPKGMPFELKHSSEDNFYSLVTKSRLDRELVPQYEIIITAKDMGSPSLSSVKTVRVELSDVNDNSPVFSQSPYTFYITENNEPGASIFKISASDADESENALISYSFGNVIPSQSYSRDSNCIDTSGNGTLCHSIQYRSGEKRYMLVGPRMSIGSTLVPGSNGNTLVVQDPGMRVSGEEELPLGTVVGNVAKDIGLDTSVLVDRNLRIVTGTKQDLLLVEDENDNRPEIDITSLSSHIPENAPVGTVVALIGVTDLDSGVNGQVVCTLAEDVPFDLKHSKR